MPNSRADADATGDWIVRFSRRKDGRRYYFRYDCSLTSREESAKRMPEEVARGLAAAITRGHPDFTARAMKYRPPKRQKPRAKDRMPQAGQGETVSAVDKATPSSVSQEERRQQDGK